MINRDSVQSILTQLGEENIILQTPTGIVANISDSDYFAVGSHSKHAIDPALRSGLDYKFFTVDKRGKKKSSGMDDGSLLHCLTLEPETFDSKYVLQKNYEEIHRDNDAFFVNVEAFKATISEHNRKHSAFAKELKKAAKVFNSSSSQTKELEITEYSELPTEYKTATLTTAGKTKALKRFEEQILVRITDSVQGDELKRLVAVKVEALSAALNELYTQTEVKSFYKAELGVKRQILNSLIDAVIVKRTTMSADEFMEYVPEQIIESALTQASKKKALSDYSKTQKSQKQQIDEKQAIDTLYNELKANQALNDSCEEYAISYLTKLPNVGNKKSDKEVFELDECIQAFERLYKTKPVIMTELVEADKYRASEQKKTLISQEQFDHAMRIVESVKQHPRASKYLSLDDNMYEVAMFWNEEIKHPSLPNQVRQVLCKLKADLLNLKYNIMADLKFVSSVDFDKMSRDAGAFNYHVQEAFYSRGFNKVCESLPDGAETLLKFVFIFVEKDAPELGKEETKPIRIRVGVYKPHHRERANQLIDASFLEIEHWTDDDIFTGFEDEEMLDVPAYQVKREMEFISSHKAHMNKKAEAQNEQPQIARSQHESESEYPSFNALMTSNSSKSNAA
ncbi:PD-(D/E)XK nuclease-like domain-containing protein [Vibrio agarivorans]|uniref:PD-(D/E)XK nuclease-like domain-containing protein n=1 Tax=Vibrio agarivorans TaxID=153622 RepID=UPI0025B61E2D|nr:hypothetical protein [Vibrio agarivorans]MDN3661166.1 hypothetical protein [Vibrio agarivorans]